MVYSVTTRPFTMCSATIRLTISGVHLHVSNLFLARQDHIHHGLQTAHTDAAGLGHGNVVQIAGANFFHELQHHGTGASRDTAGGHTDDNADFVAAFLTHGDLFQGLLANSFQFGQRFHGNTSKMGLNSSSMLSLIQAPTSGSFRRTPPRACRTARVSNSASASGACAVNRKSGVSGFRRTRV